MKIKVITLLLSVFIVSVSPYAQNGITVPRDASPPGMVQQQIGLSTVTVTYGRPSVISPGGVDRTGKIWGDVVPYGLSEPIDGFGSGEKFPWRGGANKNTVIEISHDCMVEGKSLAAGKYGLHFHVRDSLNATVIFSENTESWGSYFYSKSEDVLRVDIELEAIPLVKRLTYNFVDLTDKSCIAVLDWEYKRFPFMIEFEASEIVYENMKNELRGPTGFNWEGPWRAATYCLQKEIHLDQALVWADQSIDREKNFSNILTKSKILDAQGEAARATELRNEALAMESATARDWYRAGQASLEKALKEEDDTKKKEHVGEAISLMTRASKKWKDEMILSYGLARCYSAIGEFDTAIKHAKKAQALAPAEGTKQFLGGVIERLEKGEDVSG